MRSALHRETWTRRHGPITLPRSSITSHRRSSTIFSLVVFSNRYMIHESEPVTNQFISVPPAMGNLNCAAFVSRSHSVSDVSVPIQNRPHCSQMFHCNCRAQRADTKSCLRTAPYHAAPRHVTPHPPSHPTSFHTRNTADRRYYRGYLTVGRLPLRSISPIDTT